MRESERWQEIDTRILFAIASKAIEQKEAYIQEAEDALELARI